MNIKEFIRKYYPYIILSILSILFFLPYFLYEYPFSISGDAYGHLFKIYELCKYPQISWDPNWYVGYPIFLYYPIFFYYISLPFCSFGIKGIVFLLFLINLISSYFTYYVSRKFLDKLFSLIVTIFYQFNFITLSIMNPEGNFPMYIAINFFPLTFFFLYRLKELNLKDMILFSIVISIIFLSEVSTAFFLFISLAILLLILYKKDVIKFWKKILFTFVSVFIIVSPFYIPFLLYHDYSYFLTFQQSPYLLNFTRLNPFSVLIYPFNGHWSRFLGLNFFFIPFPYILISFIFAFLSFGLIKSFYLLPIINNIPIYRYIIPALFFTWIGSLFIKNKIKKYAFTFLTIYNLILVFIYLKPNPYYIPNSYIHIFNFISNQSGYFRYWMIPIEAYSISGYTPVFTNKPTFNGWFREGNPVFWQYDITSYYLLNECKVYTNYLDEYDIKYIVVYNTTCPGILSNYYKIVYKYENLVVYENENATFIYPKIEYKILRSNDNEYIISYNTNQSGYYLISIGYNPLWKIYIDNKSTNYYEKDGVIELYLPKGNHTIEFKFPDLLEYYIIIPIYLFAISLIDLKFKKKR